MTFSGLIIITPDLRQTEILLPGCFGKGIAGMDAGAKPTGTYSRRPLTEYPSSKIWGVR